MEAVLWRLILDFWPLIGRGLFFALMEIVAQTTFDPLGGCLFIAWYVLSTLVKSWHRLLIMQSKISSSKVAFSSPTASGGSSARVSSAPPPKRLAAPSTTFLNQNLTMSTCQEEEVYPLLATSSTLTLSEEEVVSLSRENEVWKAGHRSSSKGYDYRGDRFDEERQE